MRSGDKYYCDRYYYNLVVKEMQKQRRITKRCINFIAMEGDQSKNSVCYLRFLIQYYI